MSHKGPYLVSFLVAMIVLSAPLLCHGQYYPGAPYYPYPPTQYYAYPQPAPGHEAHFYRHYYYLTPSPQVIHRWEDYRRWLDYDHLQRSPLNPESTFNYMMRTFW